LRKALSILEPNTPSLHNFLMQDIYIPLNLSPLVYYNKLTYDGVQQEFSAFGNFQTLDDMAKIAKFLNLDEGKIAGVQTLDYSKLKQALQRDTANAGLSVTVPGNSYPFKYKSNYWSINSYNNLFGSMTACGGPFEPHMSGYGGIGVVALKSKINYLFVSDDMIYTMDVSMKELGQHVATPCAIPYSS